MVRGKPVSVTWFKIIQAILCTRCFFELLPPLSTTNCIHACLDLLVGRPASCSFCRLLDNLFKKKVSCFNLGSFVLKSLCCYVPLVLVSEINICVWPNQPARWWSFLGSIFCCMKHFVLLCMGPGTDLLLERGRAFLIPCIDFCLLHLLVLHLCNATKTISYMSFLLTWGPQGGDKMRNQQIRD